MNTQEIRGTITSVKRLANSYCGNPNFKLELETDNGVVIPVSTLNDSGINYTLGGFLEGSQATLVVKVNRKSNKLLNIKKEG